MQVYYIICVGVVGGGVGGVRGYEKSFLLILPLIMLQSTLNRNINVPILAYTSIINSFPVLAKPIKNTKKSNHYKCILHVG